MKGKEISSHIATLKNVSKREAAQILGVSIRTIDNLIYEREIDHVKVRGRVLIPYASIEHYNESHIIRAYADGFQSKEKRLCAYEQAKFLFFPQLYNANRPRNYYDQHLATKYQQGGLMPWASC